MLDTCGIMYCWTLLNVVQPSYAWTRTLMAPDAEHGLVPAATSHQLRVFGAYSRRIRAGMSRVQAASSSPQQENAVETVAAGEVTVPPGAIVTLTNVELGQAATAS
jgi:hypothetical protein